MANTKLNNRLNKRKLCLKAYRQTYIDKITDTLLCLFIIKILLRYY